ncbi:fructose-bisphosphate aldolase, class I [Kaistia soli DSM 19436]|uniref:Fructose-bisphosphate aldolase, class I n=1 Tax=Kaistia soli DSM 19436 TaxID=1122133 RepID=A0A1M5I7L9_9HYPH|nr:deoxyribose-phosphate aldolase [Kaistia soli]SHG24305.1 fructose-bisphosphate aldolase, class I [Kaistia soli DSM 19436]
MSSRLSTSYRMNRLFHEDRATLIVPVDHGVVWGRVPALESPVAVMKSFLDEDITGFMVTTGIVRSTEAMLARRPALSRVLAIDAFWPTGAPETGTGTIIASLEDAVRLGVDCVKLLLPWNVSDKEKVLYCERIAKVISDAARWEMPVMVEPVLLNVPRSPEVIAQELEVARVAYDLGADIIKITFPGRAATEMLVNELNVPILVAGGALSGDAASTIKDVEDAIVAGAQGVVVGRKVWQRPAKEAKEVIGALARIGREKFTRHW